MAYTTIWECSVSITVLQNISQIFVSVNMARNQNTGTVPDKNAFVIATLGYFEVILISYNFDIIRFITIVYSITCV